MPATRSPPARTFLLTIFHLSLSALAFYFLWIHLITTKGAAPLEPLCTPPSPQLAIYNFTPFPSFNSRLCLLSEFFAVVLQPGTPARVMSGDLLTSLSISLAAMSFEADRPGRSAWIAYPLVWGALIQNIGAAVVTPFYMLAFLLTSSRTRASDIPRANAEGALFALLFGYALPTAVMFFTRDPRAIALWQIFPVCMSVARYVYAFLRPASLSSTRSGYPIIQSAYGLALALSTLVHFRILFTTPVSDLPAIFLPSIYIQHAEHVTLMSALKQFLQWDWYFVVLSAAVGGLYSIHQLGHSRDHLTHPVTWIQLLLMVPVMGPGALLGTVWMWREADLLDVREGKPVDGASLSAAKGEKAS